MKFSACGKVILLGEHAVVYGVPAIAVGIERGAWAEALPCDSDVSELAVPAWDVRETDAASGEDPSLGRAFRALLGVTRERSRTQIGSVRVTAHADLPPGGGLGCSAALGVAIARALDPGAATPEIIERVTAWERVFHGNPSGIDAAVTARGGSLYFEKGRPIETVPLGAPLVLCVGQTGVVSGTHAMVDAVARTREKQPAKVQSSFEGIRALVRNARLAIEAGDRVGLGKLLDLNHMILAGLFVSSVEIEDMCRIAREAGALGAKLTGAGGGGSVIALCTSETVAGVGAAWKRAGFESFATEVAGSPTNTQGPREREVQP